jgi:hypothetical protein
MDADTPVRQQSNEFHDQLHVGDLSSVFLTYVKPSPSLVRSPIACYLEEGYTYFTMEGLRQPKAVLSPLSTTMKPAPGIMSARLMHTATELPIPYPYASNQVRLRNMAIYPPLIFAPDYGVFAVTYRDFEWEGRGCFMVHFWPGHADDEGNIDIGQGVFYEHKDRILQMAVGASGTYALLLVHEGNTYPATTGFLETGESYLGLLHFRATPAPHTTFRRLDIGNLSLRSCWRIAFDDSLGLVLMLNHSGTITAISYV